jgi:hypothetical protein
MSGLLDWVIVVERAKFAEPNSRWQEFFTLLSIPFAV